MAAIVATLGLAASPAAAQVPVGIDLGRAIDMPPELLNETIARLDANGIRSVRILFDLTNTKDAADQSQRLQAYRNVVVALHARGIAVLAVLDRTIVPGERDALTARVLTSDPETKGEAERWIKAYAASAGKIAVAFKDEIREFEILNEPNRLEGSGPWVSPERFAEVLGVASREIRAARRDAVVISGPLLFDDSVPGEVAEAIRSVVGYLQKTIQAAERGDLWDPVERPFDSIGLHPFILQVRGQRAKEESLAVRAYATDTLGKLVRGLVRVSRVPGMDVTVSGVGAGLQPRDRAQPDPADLNAERLRQAFVLDKVIGTLGERGLPVRSVHAFFAYDYGAGADRQRFGLLERDGGRERPALQVLRYHATRVAANELAPPVFEDGLDLPRAPRVSLPAPSSRQAVAVVADAQPATRGLEGTVTAR
jgi:hypothetical protein